MSLATSKARLLMSNHLHSIIQTLSLPFHGESERFGAVFSHWFLPRYFKAWRTLSGRDPQPRRAEGIARDPVMIYQMAKVGSRSVLFSLELAYRRHGLSNVPIHHVHNLANLDAHDRRAQRRGNLEEIQVVQEYRRLREEFEHDPSRHWNVVSLVRDPVARNVGAFFHKLDRYVPAWKQRWDDGVLPMQEVVELFIGASELHQTANNWFDVEFKSVLGIDVYAEPFQKEAGCQVYSNPPRVDLLLIRLEDLNRVAVPAIQGFFGFRDFKLYNTNVGDEKDYAEVYRAFKSTPLPSSYVESVYGTRFAHHFYSDAELQAFTRKWTGTKARP